MGWVGGIDGLGMERVAVHIPAKHVGVPLDDHRNSWGVVEVVGTEGKEGTEGTVGKTEFLRLPMGYSNHVVPGYWWARATSSSRSRPMPGRSVRVIKPFW